LSTLLSLFLISVFLIDYLVDKLGLLNKYFTLVPEVFSLLITLAIVGRILVLRKWQQPLRYVWLFVGLILVCMIAAVAEAIDPGPLFAGLRGYFKFLPLLFLPAAYEFEKTQIKVVLGTFLLMAGIQVPLAFYQRFVQFSHMMHTGDPITGTLTTSSSLTVVLCLAIALVVTLYVHRKIALSLAILLFCYLAAPTAINETKATLLLMPLSILGPFLLARGIEGRWRKVVPILSICALGLLAFMAVYNTLVQNRWGGNTIDEFLGTQHYELYLYRGVEPGENAKVIGRIDSIILPAAVLSDDWMQLLFGLGIGNVSPSSIPGMQGKYAEEYADYGFGITSIGNLIWETGVIGLCLYLVLVAFIWFDARRTAKSHADTNWYGTWWSTCTIILMIALAYKSILRFNELGFLLFFWSGYVASLSSLVPRRQGDSTERQEEEANAPNLPRLKLAGRS
jgi:hypothetical protein